MSPERVREALGKYARLLSHGGLPATRIDPTEYIYHEPEPKHDSHILWMIAEIHLMLAQGQVEKAMRWLGFIQGYLWATGVTSINGLEEDNRPDGDS